MFENLNFVLVQRLGGAILLSNDLRKDRNQPGRLRECGTAKKINAMDQGHERPASVGGRPRLCDEVVLTAVLYRMRQGCSWRSLSIFAPFTTIYTRWKQWCERGVWDQILSSLAEGAEGKLWAVDSTSVKVHKHGTGGLGGAEMQQIGTSRGGKNTKVHALVDARGRPVRLLLSTGNRHDITRAPELVEGCHDRWILADKAYDCDAFRLLLEEMGMKACIPPKAGRNSPASYHAGFYKKRHHVENFFQRIKEYRAIATRYEKLASRFLALVKLAAITVWLNA